MCSLCCCCYAAMLEQIAVLCCVWCTPDSLPPHASLLTSPLPIHLHSLRPQPDGQYLTSLLYGQLWKLCCKAKPKIFSFKNLSVWKTRREFLVAERNTSGCSDVHLGRDGRFRFTTRRRARTHTHRAAAYQCRLINADVGSGREWRT